jgi:serine/threonine protein kinase
MKQTQVIHPVEPLRSGARLAEYQVLSCLGQGGFGTTYLCMDTNLGRKCVVKEFTPHRLVVRMGDGRIIARHPTLNVSYAIGLRKFLEEALRLAQFSHPHIARILRFFEANQTAYFVMDYEAGTTLRQFVSGVARQLTEQEIEAIIRPLCSGLEQLHHAGLIHRDIKPDNILIRTDGSSVLLDFGAAASLIEAQSGQLEIIATHGYAPIEQFDPSLPQGPWIDVYALGATLYELISGSAPPHAHERAQFDTMVPAREVGRGRYSDRLLSLIDKSLAVHSSERPRSVHEFDSLLRIESENLLNGIIAGISEKAARHFINWAKPTADVHIDELVAFLVCFPVIDLSWRIGQGIPTKDLLLKLHEVLHVDVLKRCRGYFLNAGFTTQLHEVNLKTVEARLDEYAAAYLLDRQAVEWTYDNTCNQCARNCLMPGAKDRDGFVDLLREVIDRARGRVKKEFEKALRNVIWIWTPQGWKKEIRHFSPC